MIFQLDTTNIATEESIGYNESTSTGYRKRLKKSAGGRGFLGLTADVSLVLTINESENFGDGGVEFGGDEGADIEFGEGFDKIGVVPDRDVLLPRDVEDFLRNAPRAFGKDAGGGFVILVV